MDCPPKKIGRAREMAIRGGSRLYLDFFFQVTVLKNHHSHIITRLNLYQKKNNPGRRSLTTAFLTSVC